MHFITETPMLEMWNQIRYLKSPMNVENLLSGKIQSNREQIHYNPIEIPKRSYEIASCIKQADEYYKAAETVGLTTQPLLQFYGAQSLAKAVILANSDKRLSDLQYHGLATRAKSAKDLNLRIAIQDYRNDPNKWKVEDEYAITNDGVFPELCKALGETNFPQKGTLIKFKGLISIIPDLSQIYSRHYNEIPHSFRIYRGPKINSKKQLEIYFWANVNDVLSVFPEFADFDTTKMDRHYDGLVSHDEMDSLSFGAFETDVIGNYRYLIRPLESGVKKSLIVLFSGLFILSNIVRYKPAFWMAEIEGKKSGSASIVEAFCNLAKRKLPHNALESIWNEQFRFDNGALFIGP